MSSIESVSQEVERKGLLIGAPKELLVVYARPIGDGTPHVEIKDREYFYVSSERGCEIFRKGVSTENELLYLIFKSITWQMASEYELKNRIHNQDPRRVIFSKKLELLRKISSEWADLEEEEIKKILKKSPYDDFSGERADYARELRKSGMLEETINETVYKKYPSPIGNPLE